MVSAGCSVASQDNLKLTESEHDHGHGHSHGHSHDDGACHHAHDLAIHVDDDGTSTLAPDSHNKAEARKFSVSYGDWSRPCKYWTAMCG
jgi:hypothetical protein